MARPIDQDVLAPALTIGYARQVLRKRPPSRIRAIIELVVLVPAAVVGGMAANLSVSLLPLQDARWANVAFSLGMGAGCLVACALILYVARHGPATIGLTRRRMRANIGIGLLALFLTYVVLIQLSLAAVIFFPELMERSTAQKAIEESFPPMSAGQVVLMCAFVAFWEEVVFRGFLLTRLHVLLRRWTLAVPLGAVLFGIPHVYQGYLAVGVVSTLGIIMGILFAWRKSLVPPIVFHFAHNVAIFGLLSQISSRWG